MMCESATPRHATPQLRLRPPDADAALACDVDLGGSTSIPDVERGGLASARTPEPVGDDLIRLASIDAAA